MSTRVETVATAWTVWCNDIRYAGRVERVPNPLWSSENDAARAWVYRAEYWSELLGRFELLGSAYVTRGGAVAALKRRFERVNEERAVATGASSNLGRGYGS